MRRVGRALAWGAGAIEERTTATGEARYRARWRDDGRVRRRTFPTYDEAEDFLRGVEREKRDGRYVPPVELTVRQAVRDWLARGAHDWTANTLATYRQRADTHVVPALGAVRVQAMTRDRVQAWVDGLVRDGLRPATVDACLRVLSSALGDAVRSDVIAVNPCTGVWRPSVQQPAMVTWTLGEVQAVYRTVADDAWLNVWYRVALTCGLRPGEQRALQWGDVDWRRGLLHVRRTMTRDERFRATVGTRTKTGRERTVALPQSTRDALRRLQDTRHVVALDDPVFVSVHGQVMPMQSLRARHEAVCAAAGVPRITLHALRHTSATLDMHAGAHPKVVQERLGHKRIETTLNTYSHVSDDLQRAASDRLAEALDADEHDNIREIEG